MTPIEDSSRQNPKMKTSNQASLWLCPLKSITHPCSRLQDATQWPPRLKWRQDKHMLGPGPQQPSSVHSSSQVRFCSSVRKTKTSNPSDSLQAGGNLTFNEDSPQASGGLLLLKVIVWSVDFNRRFFHWSART